MPTPATSVWSRPKSEDEFEDIALDALRILWKDPHATRFARRGQKQHGVDIHGNDASNGGRLVGAQCKNVEYLTSADVDAIVAAAEAYRPTLAELLLVISGQRDAKLQQEVQVRSERRVAAGAFAVRVLFWDDIHGVLAGAPELVAKHWPGWRPPTNAVSIMEPAQGQAAAIAVSAGPMPPNSAMSAQPFAVVGGTPDPAMLVPGATAGAVGLMSQAAPPSPPSREVVVVPYSIPAGLIGKTEALQLVQAAQLRTRRGQPMFPMTRLEQTKIRDPRGVYWDENPGPGWHTQFALGFDGSVAHREFVIESRRVHPIWGTGVGLFSTLDRVIGAVLFAREILRGRGPGRAWLVLTLEQVQGQRLAFDYDDGAPRAPHLFGGDFIASRDSVRIGLNFDLAISDADVVELAIVIGEEMADHFTWPWKKDWVAGEVQKILNNVLLPR